MGDPLGEREQLDAALGLAATRAREYLHGARNERVLNLGTETAIVVDAAGRPARPRPCPATSGLRLEGRASHALKGGRPRLVAVRRLPIAGLAVSD